MSIRRNTAGSILADYTAAIVVFLLFLLWPFVDYVTVGCNYFLLRDVVHAAAQRGADCQTFSPGSSQLAVMDAVPMVVQAKAAQYPGVHVVNTMIRINQTSLKKVVTHGSWGQRWSNDIDPIRNVYTVEVAITADLKPLVAYSGPGFGTIPGLTGPMTVTYASQLVSENPTGLSQ